MRRKYEIIESEIGDDSLLTGATQTDAPAFVIEEALEMALVEQTSKVHGPRVMLRFRFLENGRYYAPVALLGKTDEDHEDFGIECLGGNGNVLLRKRVFGEQRYFEREVATPADLAPQLTEITEERYKSLT